MVKTTLMLTAPPWAWGVGNAHLAKSTPGVEFLPMQYEWVDIVVKKTERTRPLLRAAKHLADDPRMRRDLEALSFDAARLGSIIYESQPGPLERFATSSILPASSDFECTSSFA